MADAVKIVRTLYEIDLAEADWIIRSHPAWKEDAMVSAILQNQLIDIINEIL